MSEIIGLYEFEWGNKAVYWLVGCIITLKLYYVQLSCVTEAAPVRHERMIYDGGFVDKQYKKKKVFTYVHTKHQIIKYGMVSCRSQAINYTSLCSRLWVV